MLKKFFKKLFGLRKDKEKIEKEVNEIPYVDFRRVTKTGKVKAIGGDAEQGRFGVDKTIYKIKDISKSAKRVYIYLSRIADSKGYCFPFYKTIAKRCHISTSTVNRVLRELENKGLIVKIVRRYSRRGGSSNIYLVRKIREEEIV